MALEWQFRWLFDTIHECVSHWLSEQSTFVLSTFKADLYDVSELLLTLVLNI
jgi:hypothetical protein